MWSNLCLVDMILITFHNIFRFSKQLFKIAWDGMLAKLLVLKISQSLECSSKYLCPRISSTVMLFKINIHSKITNIFLFLFSNKILVIRTGIHKMLSRMVNEKDPDQTASVETV